MNKDVYRIVSDRARGYCESVTVKHFAVAYCMEMDVKAAPKLRGSCGTYAGRSLHVRYKEELCSPCREGYNSYLRDYRKRKPEVLSAIKKRQRDNNLESHRERVRKFAASHREHIKAYHRKHRKTLKRQLQEEIHTRSRRAQKLKSPFEAYTALQIIELYGFNCHICHEPINLNSPRKVGEIGWEKGLHLDHVIALSRGGHDVIENVRPAHGLCNVKKGIS